MMKNFIKLISEIIRIFKGFGFTFAVKYLFYIFLNLPQILRSKSLGVVDAKITGNVSVRTVNGSYQLLAEMMPVIREVLLKNCYGFDPSRKYSTIIDLGANRGIFSVFAAKSSKTVISVEFNELEFRNKYTCVMNINGVNNSIFIGKYIASFDDSSHISLNKIVETYSLNAIDFIKIDIEGAEEDLFSNNLEWLSITKEISMEIHPCFNVDAAKIVATLEVFEFSVKLYDLNMTPINSFNGVAMGYIWAHK